MNVHNFYSVILDKLILSVKNSMHSIRSLEHSKNNRHVRLKSRNNVRNFTAAAWNTEKSILVLDSNVVQHVSLLQHCTQRVRALGLKRT